MADFEEALRVVLDHEGGGAFTNHPADRGGPTRWGVTQATLSRWRGEPASEADVRALSFEEASSIYRARYWVPVRGDEIHDQRVATKCFDIVVNMGVHKGGHVIQLGVYWFAGPNFVIDGVIGPVTVKVINEADPESVLEELRDAMYVTYQSIVACNPSQKVFLKGWLARADWGVPLEVTA